MATLEIVAEQLAIANENTEDQAKNQEKTNSILDGIGKSFSRFFKKQDDMAGDLLEARVESQRTQPPRPGAVLAQRVDAEDKTDLSGLSKLGLIAGTLAVAIGTVSGAIAGVLKAYQSFWLTQNTFISRFFKNFAIGFNKTYQNSLVDFGRQQRLFLKDFTSFGGKVGSLVKLTLIQFQKPFLLISEAVTAAQQTVANTNSKIIKLITSPFTFIVDTLGKVGEVIKTIKLPSLNVASVSEMFKPFSSVIKGVFGAVSKLVGVLLTPLIGLYGLVTGFTQTEGNFGQKLLGAFKGAIEKLFNFFVVDFVAIILDGIGGIFRFFGAEGVANFFNRVSDSFQSGFQSIFDGIQMVIEEPGQVIEIIKTSFSNAVTSIVDVFVNLIYAAVDYVKDIAKNPAGFFSNLIFGDRNQTEAGEQYRFDRLDADKQTLVQSQKAQLVRLEVAREQGRISEDELKQMTNAIKELVEGQGVSMSTVVNAPVTTTTSSNTTMIDTPSPATDSLDRTR